ncbi:phosphate ABC transporter substrate-binding protein [Prosthecobacter sp.]|uniref:phosphate ABC transporter substrate-binding protein n=1 Tax=Prosthecobacter sp. TaxID=1965333 RepID=UPI00378353EE
MKRRFTLFALVGCLGVACAADSTPTISGIWMMGQSLCDGSESLPVVTGEDSGWGNLTFQRGVRTWLPKDNSATPELRPAELFKLVPLRAQTNGGLGETVANGMADHWQSERFGNDKARAAQAASRFLVACAGQGGRQIQELSSADLSTDVRTPESRRHGGGYYRTSLDDARRAVTHAKEMGAAFRIAALYWMQGEGNGGPTGSLVPTRWDAELPRPEGLAWYRDQLIAYRKQWSADLCAITGQGGELPMFTYQTLGPAGEAQLMAADADRNIWLVGPHYAVPSAINSRTKPGRHGDPIHLSADGERWWGEQVGKVMHRVLDRGEDWQPLRPRSAKIGSGRDSILLDFTVPRPPLVLDTAFLARQEIATKGGFASLAGFRVHDSAGKPLTLTSVEVVAPKQVRLRLSQSLPADKTCRVSYGHPYAAALGTIASLRTGSEQKAEIILTASVSAQLKPLLAEGAFFIASLTGPPTRVAIRAVSEVNGVTVLQYDPAELRNGVPFEAGQSLVAQRSFSYGNLRDSDPEASVHTFADAAYGTRAGQPYPLWNWCVIFSDLAAD